MFRYACIPHPSGGELSCIRLDERSDVRDRASGSFRGNERGVQVYGGWIR